MIILKNISKFYNNNGNINSAINKINLELNLNEFVVITGESGSGKSTLLNIISCLDNYDEGEMYIFDEDISNYSKTDLEKYRKKYISNIFQNFNLINSYTVYENIEFGLKMKKISKEEIEKRTKNIIKTVQLQDFANAMPLQLSGGQQQRIALARGLVNNPKVLLLDEPLSSLDLKLRKKMEIELKQIQKKSGITFIYVTHDQDEALSMSDRIAIINKGVIEQIDTPEDIYNKPHTLFVADFIGESNKFKANVVGFKKNFALIKIPDLKITLTVPDDAYKLDEALIAILRPEQISIAKKRDKTDVFNITYKEHIFNGNYTKVIGKLNKTDISFIVYNDEEFDKNEEIKLKYNPDDFVIVRSK